MGHFRVTLWLCFKTGPRAKHMNGLARGLLFDTEAKGNSEVDYLNLRVRLARVPLPGGVLIFAPRVAVYIDVKLRQH